MSTSSSHMMKTTRRGRPFVKDTHDLFATLMVSLKLEPHRNFFKVYPNSFTTDEACSNLASLKFSQSNRSADPKDPSRIITTTTTTTFSMTREMAKSICAHFLEAHVIENATDLQNTSFKDRGIYMLTPKGLHILERFIAKNGIGAEHLMPIFGTQPICMKMLHLERRSGDDEIMINKGVMDVLFRRFTGTQPNATGLSDDDLQNDYYRRWYNKPNSATGQGAGGEAELDRSTGMPVHKVYNAELKRDEYHFAAIPACLWLIDFTTCVGLDEASDVAAHFVRYGLITLVSDKGKVKDGNIVANVKAGGAGGGAGAMMQEAEFRATDKAIYKITKEGMILARWIAATTASATNTTAPSNASKASLADATGKTGGSPLSLPRQASSDSKSARSTDASTAGNGKEELVADRNAVSARVRELRDKNGEVNMSETDGEHHAKDSHAARLNQILDEPALRSLFREFLRTNFCEENLSFWLDVNEFRRRFSTTSSAVAGPNVAALANKKGGQGLAAMEKHQQDLINMAFVIYNTYLAPASPCELNIDHTLRGELIQYMTQVTSDKDAGIKGHIEPGVGNTLHASQLQTMLKLYDKIQTYTFRLMATDSVPKFVKTERFLTLARSLIDLEDDVGGMTTRAANLHLERAGMGGLDEVQPSPTKAYMTISQAANEKEAALKDRRLGGL